MRHQKELLRATLPALLILAVAIGQAAVAEPFADAVDAYFRGDGATTIRLMRPLAEQGDVNAQFILGGVYYAGAGIPQNYSEAMKWYTRAANQGHAEAQNYLGAMYYIGRGVPQNN